MNFRKRIKPLALAAIVALPPALSAQETIKIGGLATLEGPFTVSGQDGFRGLEMALREFNYTVAGRKIELIKGSSNASPESAVRATRKLVEQDGVRIVIGPLSGGEGLAVRDYAKTQPTVTFINGLSAAQDTTLRDPAPNFFRFNADGAQWMAGLGEYAFRVKGYKRVAVVAEDYSFPYTQVFGFMQGFCNAGGRVPTKAWVPIGNKDYASVIASLPDDVDAIFAVLGGADAVNFLTQYQAAGGKAKIIGGSVTVDQTVLSSQGKIREVVLGTPSAGPIADTFEGPEWRKFVADYKAQFPDGFNSPSLFAHAYYINTKATLLALQRVNGDTSDGGAKLREALSKLEFVTPTGKVKLDSNRQAIADIFITEVGAGAEGKLVNRMIRIIPQVNQTLGMASDQFLALGKVSRDNPSCPK